MTTSTTTAGTTMRAIIQENYGEAENVLWLGQVGRRSATVRCCCACTQPRGPGRLASWPLPMRCPGGIRAPQGRLAGG